jgi:superfamily I DNA/RNA helicase
MNTETTPIAAAVAKAFLPSPQQQDFFNWIVNGTGSCILEAVAGAGKTTTLIEGVKLMTGRIFVGAFSSDINKEIGARLEKKPGLFNGTMHSFGFSCLRKAYKNIIVEGGKLNSIWNETVTRYPEYVALGGSVLKLVSLAKQAALGVDTRLRDPKPWLELIDHYDIETFSLSDDGDVENDKTELLIKLSMKLLEVSNSQIHERVDYDDMVYGPLIHNLDIYKHNWVLVDEAQDTNKARRLLALRMLYRNGRLVAVGDPKQAIFGFTGADADSLNRIAEDTNAIRLPLSITYRCPKAVVAYAQQWVSHIQAGDTAPDGIVRDDVIENLLTVARPGDVVLCRLSKHLVANVYNFIRAGIPAKIEGRAIGEGLAKLAKRWKVKSFTALRDKLLAYKEREVAKYIAKEEESKAVMVEDMVSCLMIIVDRVEQLKPNTKTPVQDVVAEIERLFENTTDENSKTKSENIVILSTIHKAKGREWQRVIWLFTGPSPWAKKEWEMEQEVHLNYVAATRSKFELVIIYV